MKRSEAIQIIGKVLTFGKDGFPPDKKQKYQQMSLADIILTELEEAGLTPPTVYIQAGDKIFEGYKEWEDE